MRKQWVVLLVMLAAFMSGCSENESSNRSKALPKPVESIEQVTTPVQTKPERSKFSYLDQLPEEKAKQYEEFKRDKNLERLASFTPDEIFLAYLHAVVWGDEDLLYLLTYNGGQLPVEDTFRQQYRNSLSSYLQETALSYRYYDSIKVKESSSQLEDGAEQAKSIIITASLGQFTASSIYGAKKENGIWKMDMYHMVDRLVKND